LNQPTHLRPPLGLALEQFDLPIRVTTTATWPSVLVLVRTAAAAIAFGSTLAIASLNEHAPLDIHPGVPAHALAAAVPLAAAAVAAYAVMRPWPAFLLVLLLTPAWDAAQVSWEMAPFQIILQTVFIVALAAGIALRGSENRAAGRGRAVASSPDRGFRQFDRSRARAGAARFASHRIGWIATLGLLGLATVSTLLSPNFDTSLTVLMHGILEPVAMGGLLLLLVTNRRRVALVLIALGLSVALGGAMNLIQSVPAMGSLEVLQAQRLLFSRLTYFNVGLFGEMLAMAAPLLLGAVAARRTLGLGRVAVAILTIAVAVGTVSLFLTFSKSAYLATAGGTAAFFLLLVTTWRRRAVVVLVSVALSALVIPWPALVLQISPRLDGLYTTAMVKMVGASRFYSWNPSMLSGRGSLVERVYATEAAVKMATDHPLLGIGLDQFKTEYVGGYQSPQSHFPADSAHTFWPEVAAELGIPALLLVVLIFASALLALWRVYRAPPDEPTRLLALTLLASLVAWLLVATAFAGDMYRPWRNMSSDFVMMAVLTAAAFALSRAMVAGRRLVVVRAER
jgi:O-antigen ligase